MGTCRTGVFVSRRIGKAFIWSSLSLMWLSCSPPPCPHTLRFTPPTPHPCLYSFGLSAAHPSIMSGRGGRKQGQAAGGLSPEAGPKYDTYKLRDPGRGLAASKQQVLLMDGREIRTPICLWMPDLDVHIISKYI